MTRYIIKLSFLNLAKPKSQKRLQALGESTSDGEDEEDASGDGEEVSHSANEG